MNYRIDSIYIHRRILTALHMVKGEETVEALVERILTSQLNEAHPGIFDIVEECAMAMDKARQSNKERIESWKKTVRSLSPCCGQPVDEDLKRCPQCKEAV